MTLQNPIALLHVKTDPYNSNPVHGGKSDPVTELFKVGWLPPQSETASNEDPSAESVPALFKFRSDSYAFLEAIDCETDDRSAVIDEATTRVLDYILDRDVRDVQVTERPAPEDA